MLHRGLETANSLDFLRTLALWDFCSVILIRIKYEHHCSHPPPILARQWMYQVPYMNECPVPTDLWINDNRTGRAGLFRIGKRMHFAFEFLSCTCYNLQFQCYGIWTAKLPIRRSFASKNMSYRNLKLWFFLRMSAIRTRICSSMNKLRAVLPSGAAFSIIKSKDVFLNGVFRFRNIDIQFTLCLRRGVTNTTKTIWLEKRLLHLAKRGANSHLFVHRVRFRIYNACKAKLVT